MRNLPNHFRSLRVIITLSFCFLLRPAFTHAASGPGQYLKKADSWFAGDEAKRIAINILSYQSKLGGWPKNIDTTSTPYKGEQKDLKPTFDNSATTDELRFLARVYVATKNENCLKSFEKGFDYVLKAQYPSGGWPQFYPPPKSYHRRITFNDDAMTRVLQFIRELASEDRYSFIPEPRRAEAKKAFGEGIACILKCQIKVNGKLTVWCAQHDEKDYSPQPGRPYELISLSGAESVGVVRLLMSLEKPSPEVRAAIEGAVDWFKSAKKPNVRIEAREDAQSPTGKNRVLAGDPTAPPLWARFYEIETNKPIFSDRDGIKKYDLTEIGYERRNGYAWYGTWPSKLLEVEYPAWKKKVGE
jgi:PelA/Pel-15E family pectate lyase